MTDPTGAPPPGPRVDGPAHPPPGAPPPPPGAPPPGAPPPGAPPPGSWAPPPGPALWGTAHKPGAVPLKPLGLGEIYDGAFRIIRHNARATVGSAALVAVVTGLIPVLITAALTWTVGLTYDQTAAEPTSDDLTGALVTYGTIAFGAVVQSIGLLLVTAMVARVTSAAVLGKVLTLTEAWEATAGRRLKVVGLSLLLFLLFTVTWVVLVLVIVVAFVALPLVVAILLTLALVVAGLLASCWLWVRVFLLPVPALMLEDVGVLGALRRGFALSGRGFWRLFGIALLTVVIVQTASQVFAIPFGILTLVVSTATGPEYAPLVLVIGNALATALSVAFITPFSSAVTTLQYLDQRIRLEAYDVELMEQAGLTVS